ncbi:hypothetical protein MHH93_07075 [Priestia sp. FSL H7-0729]
MNRPTILHVIREITNDSGVVWIQQVKLEEAYEMMTKCERVREDHDDFRSFIPRWYTLNRS